MTNIQLDPPGGGIPFHHKMLLKYVYKPFVMRRSDWDENWEIFDRYNKKILSFAENLTPDQNMKRVLVPPIMGIEDSSRYWSILMVIEHLSIVGEGIKNIILELASGNISNDPISTAAVKPSPETPYQEALTRYQSFVKTVKTDLNQIKDNAKNSDLTKHHPWFGKMAAQDFQWLLCIHVRLHYAQVQKIAASFS